MRIHDRIHIVGSGDYGCSLTNRDDCTVYLLDCGPVCVLIDAGCGIETPWILLEIEKSGYHPDQVCAILLTHGHGDHAGGAAELAESCHASVYAMADTARFICEGDAKALAVEAAVRAGIYPEGFQIKPCPVIPLSDGQILQFGDTEIKAYLTEGHCSGHGCFAVELNGAAVVFAGDSVFCGGRISLQPIWDCDLQKYIATCKKLESLHPDCLLPSHGSVALNRGYRQIEMAMARIQELKIPENL